MSLIDSLIGFLRGGGGDQETAAGIVADELSSGKALTDDPSVGQSKTSKLNSVYLRYQAMSSLKIILTLLILKLMSDNQIE